MCRGNLKARLMHLVAKLTKISLSKPLVDLRSSISGSRRTWTHKASSFPTSAFIFHLSSFIFHLSSFIFHFSILRKMIIFQSNLSPNLTLQVPLPLPFNISALKAEFLTRRKENLFSSLNTEVYLPLELSGPDKAVMSQQLLLDISTASARSKGQARRRNQPVVSDEARKAQRNLARRERRKYNKAGDKQQQCL